MVNKLTPPLLATSHRSLLSISMMLIALYVSWGFIFTYTIYAAIVYVYASFIILMMLFGLCSAKYGFSATSLSICWVPFLLYTILGYLRNGSLENAIYWSICLIMLCLGKKMLFINSVPFKIIYWSGIIAVIGVLFQLFFPSVYSARVSHLFTTSDQIDTWGEEYGLAGFTYQVGCTSAIIIYGEAALLSMRNLILSHRFNKAGIYYFLLGLMILCVFLTGKRLLSVIALAIPFLVYFLSKKMSSKKMMISILLGITALTLFNLFVSNINYFMDSILFRRFASSYVDMQMGGDITSQRSYLYDLAIKAFHDQPVFGIGVGNFIPYTKAYTSVHNTYLQTLCEQGIVGFALYVVPLIYSFTLTISFLNKLHDSTAISFLKLSLAIQLIYILWGYTGNMNVGTSFILYFMSIAVVDKIRGLYSSRI